MPDPIYSVIIPAYNAAATLPRTLQALAGQTLPASTFEVIVVDDGSQDETAALAAAAGVQVVRQANAGPAAARNQGAALARGAILLFTDSDCAPQPDWLAQMTAPFADAEVVGVKGAYRSRQTAAMARFVQQEYEDRYDRMARFPQIDFIDTYSAAYRRQVFLDNGGFDAIFATASVEDQEFSFRLAQKGYKMIFAPDARVEHLHNETLRAYARRKFYIGYYKALLAQWLPERLLGDTHTPPVLKMQLLLLALSLGLMAPALLWTWARPLPLLGLIAFYLSALPFLAKIGRRAPAILLPALLYLPLRALALGAGFAAGWVTFRGQGERAETRVFTLRQRLAKRGLDLLVAGLGLLLLWPFLLLIALAIRLDSPGPAIFKQQRVGENGRLFTIYKFRSMVAGADKMLDKVIDVQGLAEPVYKIKNDPRRTRLGHWLRRWSLDELPQLFNVLKGEMSLVGPRPEEAWLVERYTPAQRRRLAVKPGLTGPMQINGRGDLSLEERLAAELDYIRAYSFWQDVRILLHTLPAVVRGRGAY